MNKMYKESITIWAGTWGNSAEAIILIQLGRGAIAAQSGQKMAEYKKIAEGLNKAIDWLSIAKREGVDVTKEVSSHWFFLGQLTISIRTWNNGKSGVVRLRVVNTELLEDTQLALTPANARAFRDAIEKAPKVYKEKNSKLKRTEALFN